MKKLLTIVILILVLIGCQPKCCDYKGEHIHLIPTNQQTGHPHKVIKNDGIYTCWFCNRKGFWNKRIQLEVK